MRLCGKLFLGEIKNAAYVMEHRLGNTPLTGMGRLPVAVTDEVLAGTFGIVGLDHSTSFLLFYFF